MMTTETKRLKEFYYLMKNYKRNFPEILFNMRTWFCLGGGYKFFTKKHTCGCAACALGSAALHEPFRKAGLKVIGEGIIEFKDWQNAEAGQGFFGLSEDERDQLFYPEYYYVDSVKPKHVAAKIKQMLKERGVTVK